MYKNFLCVSLLIICFQDFLFASTIDDNHSINEQKTSHSKEQSIISSKFIRELEKEHKRIVSSPLKQDFCNARFETIGLPKLKKQNIKLNDKVSMEFEQNLTVLKSKYGANVVNNIICQTLNGAKYTGSDKEWAQFIQQASNGIKRNGGEKVRLELVGGGDKLFHLPVEHKEYKFIGRINNIKQTIYNLTILDKKNNSVLTISVSGADKGRKAVLAEYTRILNSIDLAK